MRNNHMNELVYPDARAKGVLEILEFMREPEWRAQAVTIALLKRLGIAPSNESRVITSLRFLNLIDESGAPTNVASSLKSNYQATLEEQLRNSYRELFDLIPPKLVTLKRLRLFFGDPSESALYRAKLFIALCEECGIKLENLERDLPSSLADNDSKVQRTKKSRKGEDTNE